MLRRMRHNDLWKRLAVPLGHLTALLVVFSVYKLFGLTGLLVGVLSILIFYRFFNSFSDGNGSGHTRRD